MEEQHTLHSAEAREPKKQSLAQKLHIGFGLWLTGFLICKIALFQIDYDGLTNHFGDVHISPQQPASLIDRIIVIPMYLFGWSQGPLGKGFLMVLILWALTGASLGNLRLHHAGLIAFTALVFMGISWMSGPVFIPALLVSSLAIIWAARKEKLKWRLAIFNMIVLLIIGIAGQLAVSLQHSLS